MRNYHFSQSSECGLIKLGNAMIPGDSQKFAKFSEVYRLSDFLLMADEMTRDDRSSLFVLLSIIGYLPDVAIKGMLIAIENPEKYPSFLQPTVRTLLLGLKGVVHTIYYCTDKNVLDKLEWNTHINTKTEDTMILDKMSANPLLSQRDQSLLDVDVLASKKAFFEISSMSIVDRLSYLDRLKEIIMRRQEEIISKIQMDTKKSRTDALMSEMFGILEHLDFLKKTAKKSLSKKTVRTPVAMLGKKSEIYFESLGTVLIVSPWNYPFYQAIVPITCSFVAGNATWYKPSEITPLTGLVESILLEAGFKPEWVKVFYGDGVVGKDLIDKKPQKIFFTGSVETGKKIMEQASKYLIPVELELGGKDPMIVFEDANLRRSVSGAAWGILTNTGQSCTSVERLYVQRPIYQLFREELLKEFASVLIGVDKDGSADMGEMTSPKQIEIIASIVKDAIAKGAKVTGHEKWDFVSAKIPPILVENATSQMKIWSQEIFGPVTIMAPFESESDAIGLANDSDYGLSASVWSADQKRALRVSRAIVTGNVSINNVMVSEGNHALPFGGVKQSGIGRFKGEEGLRSFSSIKSILVDQNSKKIEANWYPFSKTKYDLFDQMSRGLFLGTISGFIKFAIKGMKLEGFSSKKIR